MEMIIQIEHFSSLKRFEHDLITQMLFSLGLCIVSVLLFVFLGDKKKFPVSIHCGIIRAKPHGTYILIPIKIFSTKTGIFPIVSSR